MKYKITFEVELSSESYHKIYDSLMDSVDKLHEEAKKVNADDEQSAKKFDRLMNMSNEILDFADACTNSFYSKNRRELN